MNLVGNAIKFTERGEVVVGVDLLAEEAANSALRFSVRDTGPEFPPIAATGYSSPFLKSILRCQADTAGRGWAWLFPDNSSS